MAPFGTPRRLAGMMLLAPRRCRMCWWLASESKLRIRQQARPSRAACARAFSAGMLDWRHAAARSVWCWRMRSLTPKPTTSTFGNAWEPRASFPRRRRGVPNGAIRNQMFRALSEKTVPPTRQDRKHLLGRQTQTLLARTRTQPGHPDPPSPTARPGLQPLSPEASLPSERMSTEPKCCKQKTYRKANSFRCNTYKKTWGRGVRSRFGSPRA